MNVPGASVYTNPPCNPPFAKGGKRKARGDLHESAVAVVIFVQALLNVVIEVVILGSHARLA